MNHTYYLDHDDDGDDKMNHRLKLTHENNRNQYRISLERIRRGVDKESN